MLTEAAASAKGYPTFTAHKPSFSSDQSLVLNKCVSAAQGFCASFPVVMSYCPLNVYPTLCPTTLCLTG